MEFLDLSINNFLTVGEAELELDSRGLLLIQGKNADDPSADSNGAGKSSVVDALCWALYGTTARGVTGDAVVNKTTKKDCKVSVTVTDDASDGVYLIERHRKHSTEKNQLKVTLLKDGVAPQDVSKGTDKETQDVVNQIIGCSLEVFMSAVYAGQEQMPDLPGMTDKMLKTLIEEAAGIEVLSQAYAIARDKWNKMQRLVDLVVAEQSSLNDKAAALVTDIKAVRDSNREFEEGRRERAKAELAKVIPFNVEIATLTLEIADFDEPALKAEQATCAEKLDAQRAEQGELERLNGEFNRANVKLTQKMSALEAWKRQRDRIQGELTHLDSHVGKPCGECGKVYAAEDLETARKAKTAALALADENGKPLVAEIKALRVEVAAAQEAADKFKAGMTDVSAVAARHRELSALLSSLQGKKLKVESKKAMIETIKAGANMKLTEANPWTKVIEVKEKDAKIVAESVETIKHKRLDMETELEILADAVKVFGPAGVRAHILDTVTPYLNDRTQDYLGVMSDGNIHAVWSTLSKTAKGELKEKFNIEVTNDKGAESFAGLSGGEKRKVRLATAMALQDMVASRATKPIELFIADEVDHALDESGLERLMGVLERKARERGTVMVISHNSLSDWIDEVITVTKSGGTATVTGATKRGGA